MPYADPEAQRIHAREYYRRNKDRLAPLYREAKRRRRAADPEKTRENWRRQRALDPEGASRRTREWKRRNPDHQRVYRNKHPDEAFARYLRYTYGLTLEKYREMELSQGGVCKICASAPSGLKYDTHLHVDHDHATREIRGLLCGGCNRALGIMKESPSRLEKAAAYLRQHGKVG